MSPKQAAPQQVTSQQVTSQQVTLQRFTAQLIKPRGDTLGWTVAVLPFAPKDVWTTMVRLRVRGSIAPADKPVAGQTVEFRTSLFPYQHTVGERLQSGFFLLVNRAMQQGAGVALGAMAEFTLQPDLEERPAELPEELAVLLDEEPGLRDFYEEQTENMRRELGKWVLGVKSDEARLRRASQVAERLLFAQEGERELPPAIAAAFRRRPKAQAGWSKLTVQQRRSELIAVGYYQSPEARMKRIDKLCALAESKA
jgi:hypothetical protein